MKTILIIDPKIQDIKQLDRLKKRARNKNKLIVITLCSIVHKNFFVEAGYEVLEIGEVALPLKKREEYCKIIGETEKDIYLTDDELDKSFPFNPVIISGGLNNILSLQLLQILHFFQYLVESNLKFEEIIVAYSDKLFLKAFTLAHGQEKIETSIFPFYLKQDISSSIKLKFKIRLTLKRIFYIFSAIKNKKIFIYNKSKNVRYLLRSLPFPPYHFPANFKNFLSLASLYEEKRTVLENHSSLSYEKVLSKSKDPVFIKALQISHKITVSPLYNKIIETTLFFKVLKTILDFQFYFIGEINHGISNLYLKICDPEKSFYIQHAILPGSYRNGISYFNEYKNVFKYTKFQSGKLSYHFTNQPNIKMLPYLNGQPNQSAQSNELTILFAPTTENFLFSDYEFDLIIETCKVLCTEIDKKSKLANIILKLHQKTPYYDWYKKELSAFSNITIAEKDMYISSLISSSFMVISSVNSNVIIESFCLNKPVIIFNHLKRPNYLKEYESGFYEVFDIKQLVRKVNFIIDNYTNGLEVVALQRQFVNKFIQL